jgi:hypothetical protein
VNVAARRLELMRTDRRLYDFLRQSTLAEAFARAGGTAGEASTAREASDRLWRIAAYHQRRAEDLR